jgi:hypothetical protein
MIKIDGINLIRHNRREKLNKIALTTFVLSVTAIAYMIIYAN